MNSKQQKMLEFVLEKKMENFLMGKEENAIYYNFSLLLCKVFLILLQNH